MSVSSASYFFICCLLLASSAGAFVINSKQITSNSPRSFTAAMSSNDNEEEKEIPVSGSFFNQVPPLSSEPTDSNTSDDDMLIDSSAAASFSGDDMEMFQEIIKKTKLNRESSGKGFSKTTLTTDHAVSSVIQTTSTDSSGEKKSFVGIGKPLNDVQNPEYDENGYTLYADETTGEKKRVFEALVEYPSIFKMKIVGQDDEKESFAPEIVEIVAKSCGVEESMVKHTMRKNGKWTSVTVHAPVKSADMLYSLYANVDKNPRVKFKF